MVVGGRFFLDDVGLSFHCEFKLEVLFCFHLPGLIGCCLQDSSSC